MHCVFFQSHLILWYYPRNWCMTYKFCTNIYRRVFLVDEWIVFQIVVLVLCTDNSCEWFVYGGNNPDSLLAVMAVTPILCTSCINEPASLRLYFAYFEPWSMLFPLLSHDMPHTFQSWEASKNLTNFKHVIESWCNFGQWSDIVWIIYLFWDVDHD